MARDHARVLVAVWGDRDWRALPSQAQRVYILALSQPGLTYAGVAPYSVGGWAKLATDTSQNAIRKAVNALEERRYVVVDEETDELFIRTFVRHDNVLRFPNVAVAMARAYHQIVSPEIRHRFLIEIRELANGTNTKDLPGWDKPEVAQLLLEEA